MHITTGAVPARRGAVLIFAGCVSLPPVVHVEREELRGELQRQPPAPVD
jgi:hypothetical protein